MSFTYARIMNRIVNCALMVHPRTAMTIYNFLSSRGGWPHGELPDTPDAELIDERLIKIRTDNETLTPREYKASRFAGDLALSADGRKLEPYRLAPGGVGVVSVIGELVNRGAWLGSHSGMTSYEGVKHQLARIAGDSRVRSVILDIDSPGGEAVGFDLAASAVRQLNEQKPVVAVVNGMAASAAYALASGAKRIIASPTGVAGSIGVVLLHLDMSEKMAKAGVTPTLITAGAHKADGNPFEALPESVRLDLQAEVNSYYDEFIKVVSTGRVGRLSAKAARATEARTYIGQEAVDARIVDDIGSFEDVLSDLSRKGARKVSQARSNKAMSRSLPLIETDLEPDAEIDLKPILAEATNGGIATGQAAQVARFAAILDDERSKGRERVAFKIAVKAPDMSASDVLDLAVEAQTSVIPPALFKPFAERNADTGADRVTSEPEMVISDPKKREVERTGSGWNKAVEKANSRTALRAPRRN